MPYRREIRRLAMQILYQIDLRGEADIPMIQENLKDGPDLPVVREGAMELAVGAWGMREEADALVSELAPAWPTHRQPPVDRAILRLAYYEMRSGYSPIKVAINEAVELAKAYSSSNSPAFINGVLDKVARRLEGRGDAAAESGRQEAAEQTVDLSKREPEAGAADMEPISD